MNRLRYVFCFAFICILSTSTLVKAAQYKLHVLDVPHGRAYSAAYQINDEGIIAGIAAGSYSTRDTAGVYYWDTTGLHYAGFSLTSYSIIGLNNSGTIVGSRYVSDNSTLSTLPTLLPSPYGENILADINDTGIVVGWSKYDYYARTHAALWDAEGIHDLGTLAGDTSSRAIRLNNGGTVVGESTGMISRGVIWSNGNKVETGILPRYTSSIAHGINNREVVIGSCYNPDYFYTGAFEKAFIWQNGQLVDLLNRSDVSSFAADINDNGQIVGYTYTYYGQSTAFLYENGAITTLEGLGGETRAFGINSDGWIVGQAGSDANWHAVVWEPIPEPSSIIVLFGGLCSLYCSRRRKRA